ncbi:MAG: hypothetical protein D6708_00090, partial [Candidatus Dadabacteria bacterium]
QFHGAVRAVERLSELDDTLARRLGIPDKYRLDPNRGPADYIIRAARAERRDRLFVVEAKFRGRRRGKLPEGDLRGLAVLWKHLRGKRKPLPVVVTNAPGVEETVHVLFDGRLQVLGGEVFERLPAWFWTRFRDLVETHGLRWLEAALAGREEALAGVQVASLEEHREFFRNLGLPDVETYLRFNAGRALEIGLPAPNILSRPDAKFGAAWGTVAKVLGIERRAYAADPADCVDLETFVRRVKRLGLTSQAKYDRWYREAEPSDMPADPRKHYGADGFSWHRVRERKAPGARWRPFDEACAFVAGLGLRSKGEWEEYLGGKRSDLPPLPPDIPRRPDVAYRGQWKGFSWWLGRPTTNRHVNFPTARQYARAAAALLHLNTRADWNRWWDRERPALIPKHPHEVYRSSGWAGWRDWLGT